MKTAYVFPGQGAQTVGMGRDLFESRPICRDLFLTADAAVGFPLSRLCFEGPEEELRQTINVQPAIVTVSLALLAAARDMGLAPPLMVAGHSLGEYSALAAAGAIEVADVIRLARARGRLMHEASLQQPGAMLALLGADAAQANALAEASGAEVANYNCPGQIVISGHRDRIAAAGEKAKDFGVARAVPLAVSGAFHSELMQPAVEGMIPVLDAITFKDPDCPVIANTTGAPLTRGADIKDELLAQLRNSVRWQTTVEYMLAQGVERFYEIGPGKVLSGLVRKTNADAVTVNLGDAAQLVAGVTDGA